MTTETPPEHVPGKRRKFKFLLVAPGFQLTLLVSNWLMIGCISYFVILFARKSEMEFLMAGASIGLTPEHPYFGFIRSHLNSFAIYISSGIILGTLVSTLLTLVISHKLAGPFVRLRGYFEEMERRGEVTGPLKFRKWDFTGKLDDIINSAIARVLGRKPEDLDKSA